MESLINCARFKPCFFSTISNSAASFTFIKRVRGAPAHARADVHARYMHARARARTCANLSFGRTDGRSVRREQRTRFFTFFSSLTACFPRLKGVEPPPRITYKKLHFPAGPRVFHRFLSPNGASLAEDVPGPRSGATRNALATTRKADTPLLTPRARWRTTDFTRRL